MSEHRFSYRWNLRDGYPAERNGLRVFSTFACGGGSTMGYKLAGYEVLGCLEIDPQIIAVYKTNHRPALAYCEDIRTFKDRADLPPDLFDLDILDGSPPCSSFSMSGNRDRDWGKTKHFREGQSAQRLDDLFFSFIDLAARLQPKVIVAENVKGMIIGKAKGYCKEIKREMEAAGYDVQLFLLNAASMGVPQKRERVFFIARRKDLGTMPLRLDFTETAITYGEIREEGRSRKLSDEMRDKWWQYRQSNDKDFGDIALRRIGRCKLWNRKIIRDADVLKTIASFAGAWHVRDDVPREITVPEMISAGTFPRDYAFGAVDPKYLIGMSVPPVMVAQIATEIRGQWFAATGDEAA